MTSAKPGIVLDVGRDRHLPAGLDALDEHRLQHGARGIDRGRVAGRARAEDNDFGVLVGHDSLPRRGGTKVELIWWLIKRAQWRWSMHGHRLPGLRST